MNKIIISDTSCLIALSKIDKLNILQQLFQTVFITEQVKTEFGAELPDWFIAQRITDLERFEEMSRQLDSGEASSITLALENPGCLLIIDERKGRLAAKRLDRSKSLAHLKSSYWQRSVALSVL